MSLEGALVLNESGLSVIDGGGDQPCAGRFVADSLLRVHVVRHVGARRAGLPVQQLLYVVGRVLRRVLLSQSCLGVLQSLHHHPG